MALNGPILLIEDDLHDTETIREAVKELGLANEVKPFRKAQQAYDYLMVTEEQPMVIFCDVRLPEKDGLSFRRDIMDEPYLKKKSIPFVFLTGLVSEKLVNSAFDLDVQGFFEKPRSYQALKDNLLTVLIYWSRSFHPNREFN